MNRRLTLLYAFCQVALVFLLMELGWGGLDFLKLPPVLGLLFAMTLGSFTILHTEVDLHLKDWREIWGLVATLLLSLFYFFFLPMADRNSWYVFVPGDDVRYTGLLLFFVGTGLRTWGFMTRQEKMSITGLFPLLDENSFVDRSIYFRTRHPQYLGLWLQLVGFSLAFRSALGLVGALVMIAPVVARVDAEEKLLKARLGAKYEDYLKRSWRFFPGVY
ncbi:MAG: methyltransferase family protein [Chitinophagales bacterium]